MVTNWKEREKVTETKLKEAAKLYKFVVHYMMLKQFQGLF